MERLDQAYLTNIIAKAQKGSSNAFAESCSAGVQRHYMYLYHMLGSSEAAEEMLKQLYVKIYRGLPSLAKPELYMPWSCRLAFRCCHEENSGHEDSIDTPAGTFTLSQLMGLPVSESQTAIMYYTQGIPIKDIAAILNFDTAAVKRSLRSALAHLTRGISGRRAEFKNELVKDNKALTPVKKVTPDEDNPAGLLEYVFETCDAKPNTIPVEALAAYAVYRKERFTLQRGILAGAMVLFLLLPLLFVMPRYDVSGAETGERGLPVYTVNIRSLIPAGKVKARINSHTLPVYEASRRIYTVEPTRNGELTIEVELINRQSLRTEYAVTDVDAEGPQLTGSSADGTIVKITVEDAGVGVDFRETYALGASGEIHYPLSYDEKSGEIIFEYPEEKWDVYVPDHIGNILHLAFTFD